MIYRNGNLEIDGLTLNVGVFHGDVYALVPEFGRVTEIDFATGRLVTGAEESVLPLALRRKAADLIARVRESAEYAAAKDRRAAAVVRKKAERHAERTLVADHGSVPQALAAALSRIAALEAEVKSLKKKGSG